MRRSEHLNGLKIPKILLQLFANIVVVASWGHHRGFDNNSRINCAAKIGVAGMKALTRSHGVELCMCARMRARVDAEADFTSWSLIPRPRASAAIIQHTRVHAETASSKLALKAKLGFHGHPLSLTS